MPAERMLPPRPLHVSPQASVPPCAGSGWEQRAAAALPWWNNEVGELVLENPNVCRTHCRWKTPDLLPRHPSHQNPSKGRQVLGTLLAHSFPGCVFLVPASCWVCASVAWGIPPETACSHRSHTDLTEARRCTIQPHPRVGFQEMWEGWDQQREPCTPRPRGKWLWWQQPGRLNTTAVPWQGHRTWDLPGGRLILGVLRRGYFGPFALRESPAIFQPHWGYFRGRAIYTD